MKKLIEQNRDQKEHGKISQERTLLKRGLIMKKRSILEAWERSLLNQVKEDLCKFCLRQTSISEKSDISVTNDVLSAEGTTEQLSLSRTLSMQLKSPPISKKPCERK